MAEERKLSKRDETLISVLDRLSDNVAIHETLLEDVLNQLKEILTYQKDLDANQRDLSANQAELVANTERVGLNQHARHDVTDDALSKTHEALLRYRSDILSLVNEQDRLNEVVIDFSKRQTSIAHAQNDMMSLLLSTVQQLESLDKAHHDLVTSSVRHEEVLSDEISGMNRTVGRLHMDTEKRLVEMHRETQRQLKEFKIDIERRLLSLDKIEASLHILLVRTEPPVKKAFFIIRFLRWLRWIHTRGRKDEEIEDDI